MRVINWKEFKPIDSDIKALVRGAGQSVYIRLLTREMVQKCLKAYPWQAREDLVSLFSPSQSYHAGEVLAIPIVDAQRIRPDTWRIGIVKSVQVGENSVQGKFQVVQLVVDGKDHWLSAAIVGATPLAFRFPPEDDELDFVVDDFINHYFLQLSKVIDDLIAGKKLNAVRQEEQVVFGRLMEIKTDFQSLFDALPTSHPFLTLDDIVLILWDAGELTDTSEALARFLVTKRLRENGYQDMGRERWTTSAKLAELDRQISRRLEVPRSRSKVKAQWNQAEELDAEDYLDLPDSGHALLEELDIEEGKSPEPASEEWKPPTAPIKMPGLSYLNIMQGYFPLNDSLIRAFSPRREPGWVDIQIVDGDEIPFVVNFQKRELKSVDSQVVYQRFVTDLNIPAGTFLWLEYKSENRYRIAPRPLPTPRSVRCKQAWLEGGVLHVEEVPIEMKFEGDGYLFKAELRFESLDALFREAEERDVSIFDAIYDALPKLAALRPDGLVHHKDIFNAVFFEYRMCSYHTVVHELYDHACFDEVGNGFFRFVPEKGVARRKPTRRQAASEFWIPQPILDVKKPDAWSVEPTFWRQIATKISRNLHTLDEHKPFEITSVTHETIELVVSTGQPRSVPRAEVEQAWNELSLRGKIDRERVTEYANFNAAYVLAILAQLPGVSYKLKPLRLMYEVPNEISEPQLQDIATDQKHIYVTNDKIPFDQLGVFENLKPEITSPVFQGEEQGASSDKQHLDPVIERTRSGQFIAPDLLPPAPLFANRRDSDSEQMPAPQSEVEVNEGAMVIQPDNKVALPAKKFKEEDKSRQDREAFPVDLKTLIGRRMFTLRFALAFFVKQIDRDGVVLSIIRAKGGSDTRKISVNALAMAWNQLERNGRFRFVEIFQEVLDDSAYIAAILSTHHRVTFDKQRVELVHAPVNKSKPVAEVPPRVIGGEGSVEAEGK